MRPRRAARLGILALLVVGGCGKEPEATRSRAEIAVPTSALPRSGTIADPRPGALQVGITADGGSHTDEGLVDLEGLAQLAAIHARRPQDLDELGESTRALVPRVHPEVPWEVVGWVGRTLSWPPIRIYRLHLAVGPEGEGAEGTLWLDLRTPMVPGEKRFHAFSTLRADPHPQTPARQERSSAERLSETPSASPIAK